MLREARETGNTLVAEAKDMARAEASKIILAAKASIENEKKAAVSEMKVQIASLSLEIAEKILKSELGDRKKQEDLVRTSIEKFKLN